LYSLDRNSHKSRYESIDKAYSGSQTTLSQGCIDSISQ